jgi:RNA polymerase sigma factor (sigma-70 family)
MDEAVTITSMQAAQKKNINQTIQEYSKRLLGFIRKRVRTEEDAEDILQDVFYQFVGNTTPIEQVTAWLFTVARNKITDKKRKHKPENLEDIFSGASDDGQAEWSNFFFEPSADPETEYLRSMFWDELNRALDELPAEQKEVFVLHELEQMPFKEISEKTGESVNTLISRKRYAVLHLRERLQVLKNELLNY